MPLCARAEQPPLLQRELLYRRNDLGREPHVRRSIRTPGAAGILGHVTTLAESAIRLGTLTSALGVGALPEYTLNRRSLNGYLLVPSGGCFVMHETGAGG